MGWGWAWKRMADSVRAKLGEALEEIEELSGISDEGGNLDEDHFGGMDLPDDRDLDDD